MKQILMISFLVVGLTQVSYGQDEIKGHWLAGEGKSIVAFTAIGDGVYQGKIAWMERSVDKKGELFKDKNNPDKSLRNREILGLPMVERLDYKDGAWTGKLYSPKNGRTVNATFTLEGEDRLKVCISFRGFKRTQYWQRTELPQ